MLDRKVYKKWKADIEIRTGRYMLTVYSGIFYFLEKNYRCNCYYGSGCNGIWQCNSIYLKKKSNKDAPVVDYEAMAKDETVIRALSVKKQYDEFEKNYYNDYVNNIDSSNVSKVTIQYNISGASNIDDLMENYKIFVAGEEVRKAIIEKQGIHSGKVILMFW